MQKEWNNFSKNLRSSGNEALEKKLMVLLNVAMVCIAIEVKKQLPMWEVLQMIKEARAMVMV